MGFGLGKVLGKAFEVFKMVAPILLTFTGIGAPFAAMMGGMGGMMGGMGGMMGMGGGSMISSLLGSFTSFFGGGAGSFMGEGALGFFSSLISSAKDTAGIADIVTSCFSKSGSRAEGQNQKFWLDATAFGAAQQYLEQA